MSLLANLKTDDSIENEVDRAGGNYGPVDSGLYDCTVELAYLEQSSGGALGLNLTLKTSDNHEIRERLWLTSGEAKGKKNFYVTKEGEKKYLPGFLIANSLALLTVGKEISDLAQEDKIINVWNSEANAEVPTKVPMLVELLGTEIIAGVIRQVENKRVEVNGNWVNSADTRDVNVIDKLFRKRDKLTTAEIRAQATEAAFIAKWDSKFTGTLRDRTESTSSATGQSSGAFRAAAGTAQNTAGGAAKPSQSLFN